MPRPSLAAAMTWDKFENAVLEVFTEALRRLAKFKRLPAAEEPLNLELYWLARQFHHELLRSQKASIPFAIIPDSTNQPEPDDSARSKRLKKRPDFSCILNNPQEADFRKSQASYNLECKRLGNAEGNWVLNENYSEHGMQRFVHESWLYAKGCPSATMIGYLQNMAPEDVLVEVNSNSASRGLPSLSMAAASWAARGVTPLSKPTLSRPAGQTHIQLGHLWVDLRHCVFDVPSNSPPQTPADKSPAKAAKPKKAAAKKADATSKKAPVKAASKNAKSKTASKPRKQ